jgi:hypothetical protein
MVIYTCILRRGSKNYECYQGFREFPNLFLDDYKNISIPPSELKFHIFKKYEEISYIKLFLPQKYWNRITYPELYLF